MPNKPRPENRHRMVRVEDELWTAAKVAAIEAGTTRSDVMRAALRALVAGEVLTCQHLTASERGPNVRERP